MVDHPISDGELKLARQGAMSAARSGRGIVPLDDLVSEASLWMLQHLDKVTQWRDEGRHGQNKLRNACRQRCLTVVAQERKKKLGPASQDLFYYTNTMIMELLPATFDEDDWVAGQSVDSGELRSTSRPAEGHNRLAMICDIRNAFFMLNQSDQELLRMLHKGIGLSYEQAGVRLDVHERTVRRREERALERMVERLGGEPPWRWRRAV